MVISDDDIVKHIVESTQKSLLELRPMVKALGDFAEAHRSCQICHHAPHPLPLPLGNRGAIEDSADDSL